MCSQEKQVASLRVELVCQKHQLRLAFEFVNINTCQVSTFWIANQGVLNNCVDRNFYVMFLIAM